MAKQEKPEYKYVVPLIKGEFNLDVVREYAFRSPLFPRSKWRFDYAIVPIKLAIEIEGGIWIQGGHSRGSGFMKNIDKYNEATIFGWHLLRFAPAQIIDRIYLDKIRRFLYNKSVSDSLNQKR